ncbi:hypothetical protein [Neofamilia massiliensis]|uniref:hypothetical protein n=1 Tax=Neofamilia massiliensis TaxID=1673724 RepID=UPI0006BB86B9|nr:hypothetical protein [Neofamilia massiliensis]
MKNKFFIILLGLALVLTGCSKNKDKNSDGEINNPSESPAVTIERQSESENLDEENTNLQADENLNNEENTNNEETEEEETEENSEEDPEVSKSLEDEIKTLEENSDYISIIKMSQTGPNGKEIHVVEDLKGSLKNIVLPDIPNMQANYNYLIFLMDGENGDITLTDSERGLILIENTTDERLILIKELLKTDDTDEN